MGPCTEEAISTDLYKDTPIDMIGTQCLKMWVHGGGSENLVDALILKKQYDDGTTEEIGAALTSWWWTPYYVNITGNGTSFRVSFTEINSQKWESFGI